MVMPTTVFLLQTYVSFSFLFQTWKIVFFLNGFHGKLIDFFLCIIVSWKINWKILSSVWLYNEK